MRLIMGAKKMTVSKDWWKSNESGADLMRTKSRVEVIKSEDLPELMTIIEGAEFYKCHPKTLQEWISTKQHGSIKLRGRRFITPQHIHYFIETQRKKNG